MPNAFKALGTDGYGRSDGHVALRRFFETNTANVVVAVLSELCALGEVDPAKVQEAIEYYGIEVDTEAPWTVN